MATILPEPPKPSDPRFIDWLYRLWKRVTSTTSEELGLGTMADQDADAVAITGGSFNGTVGATTPAAGIFTTVSASTSVSTAALKAADGTSVATIANSTGVITIPSSVLTTADINGGTVDGAVIGGSSAAAGTFTTLTTTGNVTLGDATSDTVTVNGYIGVGVSPNSTIAVNVGPTSLTGTNQIGAQFYPTATSSATSSVRGVYARGDTAAASFTTGYSVAFYAADPTKGAGSTITNLYGVYITDQTQGTNNYGITSLVSSGTNKWNIYASGTAANYFAGNVLVGVTSATTNGGKIETSNGITFPATQSACSNANTLDDYREATATLTATGMTTAPTGTASFVRAGNKVTMEIPAISGTSNATTFTLTGVPTALRPSASRAFVFDGSDNGGANFFGRAVLDTSGVITLYTTPGSGAWTNSGTKATIALNVSYII